MTAAAAAFLLTFFPDASQGPGQIDKAMKNGALLSIDRARSGLVTERHKVGKKNKLKKEICVNKKGRCITMERINECAAVCVLSRAQLVSCH